MVFRSLTYLLDERFDVLLLYITIVYFSIQLCPCQVYHQEEEDIPIEIVSSKRVPETTSSLLCRCILKGK